MKHSQWIVWPFLLLLSACGGGGTEDQPLGSETFRYNIPSGTVQDLRYGKEAWFAYGPIAGTVRTAANGLAKMHVFEKGRSLSTLQVNIALSKDGYFYEGWLINSKTKERISTGHLKSIFGDVRHNLDYSVERDLRDFTQVIITVEKDDGNPAPGLEVASSLLKELKRD